MGGKYKVYPEYKDSGVDWLGVVPTEWDMWKLNHAYDEIGSGTTPPSSSDEWYGGDIPWVTTGELRESEILDTTKKITEDTVKRFPTLRKYPKGSIAIAMYGATIGRLGIFGVEATTNQACCVLTKSKVINNKYLYYWLQAFRQDIVNLASGGGQPNINQEVVASLKISSPDKSGQHIIANFLDHETAKIDTLIEEQQSLIRLLKEKRQAVISHAVTKGLNPDAPMKDSGVEWLGEVPEHWGITRIGWLCEFISYGFTNPMPSVDDGPYMLTAADIDYGKVKYNSARRTSKEAFDSLLSAKSKPECGDLLLTKDGTLGRVSVFTGEYETCISQSVALLRLHKKQISPEFLEMALMGAEYQKKMIFDAGGTTIKHIYISILAKMNFAVPSLQEQEKILSELNTKLCKMDILIQQAQDASDLLTERRTALVSAAVTGKIDVRDWVAPQQKQEVEATA